MHQSVLNYCFVLSLLFGCDHNTSLDTQFQYVLPVISKHPTDSGRSTQCLAFASDGSLWSTSGDQDESFLLRFTPSIGETVSWPVEGFAEGCTELEDLIIILTWKDGQIRRFSRSSKSFLPSKKMVGEGWGIARSSQGDIVYSDGSSELRWIDAESLLSTSPEVTINRVVTIRDQFDRPVFQMNELEFIGPYLLANVYPKDQIAVINPTEGRVLLWLDLTSLRIEETSSGVLNGIAYEPNTQQLWVTGKRWHQRYQLDSTRLLEILKSR